jgi:uncharacterized membrane protein YccF (DUF307 family)
MKSVGNVLWLIFGGLLYAVAAYISAIVCFVSIIFIPVGLQFIKIGNFFLWPMGKNVIVNKASGFKTLINFIWMLLCGWECAFFYLFTGILLCLTIVGMPFGLQYFKIVEFVLLPLGHDFQ